MANKGGGGNEQYYRYEPSPPYTVHALNAPVPLFTYMYSRSHGWWEGGAERAAEEESSQNVVMIHIHTQHILPVALLLLCERIGGGRRRKRARRMGKRIA